MTIRIGKLNGKNLNYLDHDASSLDYALINQGIIEGMQVTNGFVGIGRAIIGVKRTNTAPHQNFMVHTEITTREPVSTSGTKKIWLEVNKQYINDGTLAKNPNGEGIARIVTGADFPGNDVFFLPLASIVNGQITDERKFISKKIPDIRGKNRKPKDYHTQGFHGPEFVEGSTIGISNISWLNLHTYCSWKNHEPQYTTQLAITAQGQPGIWIRKARSIDDWHDWQQVFPFTASALDIGGLPEYTSAITPSLSSNLIFQEANGSNKRVTLDNFRKWITRGMSSTNFNVQKYNQYTNGTTTSVAVPKGGFWSLSGIRNGSDNLNVEIQYSENNSSWSNIVSQSFDYTDSVSLSGFVKQGFIRARFPHNQNWKRTFSVQIF